MLFRSNLAQQLVNQVGSSEALYRINVQLADQAVRAYGERIPLRPGLTLEADVLQESRKVWEWVLEPVLAVKHKLKVLGEVGRSNTSAVLDVEVASETEIQTVFI